MVYYLILKKNLMTARSHVMTVLLKIIIKGIK